MSKLKYALPVLAGAGTAICYRVYEWREEGRKEIRNEDTFDLRSTEIEVRDYFEQLKQGEKRDKIAKIKEILTNPEEYFYNSGRQKQLEKRDDLEKYYDRLQGINEEKMQGLQELI